MRIGYSEYDCGRISEVRRTIFRKISTRRHASRDLVQPPVTRSLPALRDRTFDLVMRDRLATLTDDHYMDDIDTEVAVRRSIGGRGRHRIADGHAAATSISPSSSPSPGSCPRPRDGVTSSSLDAFKTRGLGVPAASLMTNTMDLRVKLLAGGRFIIDCPYVGAPPRQRERLGLKQYACRPARAALAGHDFQVEKPNAQSGGRSALPNAPARLRNRSPSDHNHAGTERQPIPPLLAQLGTRSEAPRRYLFRSVYRRARPSPRDVARFRHTRRSAMTFMAAARTSAQRAAFDIVSIVPSISMPWTTLPTTMTTARDI